jgi:hypothetical protein
VAVDDKNNLDYTVVQALEPEILVLDNDEVVDKNLEGMELDLEDIVRLVGNMERVGNFVVVQKLVVDNFVVAEKSELLKRLEDLVADKELLELSK